MSGLIGYRAAGGRTQSALSHTTVNTAEQNAYCPLCETFFLDPQELVEAFQLLSKRSHLVTVEIINVALLFSVKLSVVWKRTICLIMKDLEQWRV